MISMYFNSNGRYYADAADVSVSEENLNVRFFLAEAPDVPRWRLTMDLDSGVVTDRYDGMTTEEAEAQLDIDIAAEAAPASDDPA